MTIRTGYSAHTNKTIQSSLLGWFFVCALTASMLGKRRSLTRGQNGVAHATQLIHNCFTTESLLLKARVLDLWYIF
ncbi:MAG: hypothetical protein HOP04_05750 [Methylophilaceae bacterium]|nr:hypothetical protein [Methylophilaceae bacterium]